MDEAIRILKAAKERNIMWMGRVGKEQKKPYIEKNKIMGSFFGTGTFKEEHRLTGKWKIKTNFLGIPIIYVQVEMKELCMFSLGEYFSKSKFRRASESEIRKIINHKKR